MKRLFLTSSVNFVAKDIAKHIGNVKGMKLVFIDTAAEVEEGDKQWLKDDKKALVDVGFNVFDYTITGKRQQEIRKDLKEVDVIYVEGGNEFYLMQEIRKSGFDKIVCEHVDKGQIYIGTSAGSMVAGPDISLLYTKRDALKGPKLESYKGLGLVDFCIIPHWGSKYFRSLYIKERLPKLYKTNKKMIFLTDYQYVRVEEDMYRIEEVEK